MSDFVHAERASRARLPGRRLVLCLCILSAVILSGCVSQEGAVRELSVPGTGACEEILNRLAEEFNSENPGYNVTVPPSTGSSGGIRSVAEGEALVARVARELKEDEVGQGLSYSEFGRDIVLFGVSGDVNVTSLTSKQVAGIFSGEIEYWSGVGGANSSINVFIREPGDSSLGVIEEHISLFKGMNYSSRAKMLYHDYDMVDNLEKYQNSIGFLTGNSLIGTSIKPVSLDGVSPTSENVLSGSYRLSLNCALVYHEGRLNEVAGKFIDFVFSDAGKEVLEDNGLIPVGK